LHVKLGCPPGCVDFVYIRLIITDSDPDQTLGRPDFKRGAQIQVLPPPAVVQLPRPAAKSTPAPAPSSGWKLGSDGIAAASPALASASGIDPWMFAAAVGVAAAAATTACICVRYARTALRWMRGARPGESKTLSTAHWRHPPTVGGDADKHAPPEPTPPLIPQPQLTPAAEAADAAFWRVLPPSANRELGGDGSGSTAGMGGGSVVGWQLPDGPPAAAPPRRSPSPCPAPTRPILRSPSISGEGGWAAVAAAAAAATGGAPARGGRRVSLQGDLGVGGGGGMPGSVGHNPPPPVQSRSPSPSGSRWAALRRSSAASSVGGIGSGRLGAQQQPAMAGVGSIGTSRRDARVGVGGSGGGGFGSARGSRSTDKPWSIV
jgi:hypothetical protein